MCVNVRGVAIQQPPKKFRATYVCPISKLDKPERHWWAAQIGRVFVVSSLTFVVMLACLNLPRAYSPRAERVPSDVALDRDSKNMHPVTHRVASLSQSAPPGFYSLHAQDVAGNDVAMQEYRGKVLYITNVATF
jgi:hypothetical protein